MNKKLIVFKIIQVLIIIFLIKCNNNTEPKFDHKPDTTRPDTTESKKKELTIEEKRSKIQSFLKSEKIKSYRRISKEEFDEELTKIENFIKEGNTNKDLIEKYFNILNNRIKYIDGSERTIKEIQNSKYSKWTLIIGAGNTEHERIFKKLTQEQKEYCVFLDRDFKVQDPSLKIRYIIENFNGYNPSKLKNLANKFSLIIFDGSVSKFLTHGKGLLRLYKTMAPEAKLYLPNNYKMSEEFKGGKEDPYRMICEKLLSLPKIKTKLFDSKISKESLLNLIYTELNEDEKQKLRIDFKTKNGDIFFSNWGLVADAYYKLTKYSDTKDNIVTLKKNLWYLQNYTLLQMIFGKDNVRVKEKDYIINTKYDEKVFFVATKSDLIKPSNPLTKTEKKSRVEQFLKDEKVKSYETFFKIKIEKIKSFINENNTNEELLESYLKDVNNIIEFINKSEQVISEIQNSKHSKWILIIGAGNTEHERIFDKLTEEQKKYCVFLDMNVKVQDPSSKIRYIIADFNTFSFSKFKDKFSLIIFDSSVSKFLDEGKALLNLFEAMAPGAKLYIPPGYHSQSHSMNEDTNLQLYNRIIPKIKDKLSDSTIAKKELLNFIYSQFTEEDKKELQIDLKTERSDKYYSHWSSASIIFHKAPYDYLEETKTLKKYLSYLQNYVLLQSIFRKENVGIHDTNYIIKTNDNINLFFVATKTQEKNQSKEEETIKEIQNSNHSKWVLILGATNKEYKRIFKKFTKEQKKYSVFLDRIGHDPKLDIRYITADFNTFNFSKLANKFSLVIFDYAVSKFIDRGNVLSKIYDCMANKGKLYIFPGHYLTIQTPAREADKIYIEIEKQFNDQILDVIEKKQTIGGLSKLILKTLKNDKDYQSYMGWSTSYGLPSSLFNEENKSLYKKYDIIGMCLSFLKNYHLLKGIFSQENVQISDDEYWFECSNKKVKLGSYFIATKNI